MDETTLSSALDTVKTALNRLDGNLDNYLTHRIKAACEYLAGQGLHLDPENSDADFMLIVDVAVWQYNSRDANSGEPEHLRERIRKRWLRERGDPE